MDDRIRQLLRELGTAINESISTSDLVSRHIERIRQEGYEIHVVLDATIGLNRQGEAEEERVQTTTEVTRAMTLAMTPVRTVQEAQFRINVEDLSLLRSLGIDPTRKVRAIRRTEPIGKGSDEREQ